jgi:hypothetical protein
MTEHTSHLVRLDLAGSRPPLGRRSVGFLTIDNQETDRFWAKPSRSRTSLAGPLTQICNRNFGFPGSVIFENEVMPLALFDTSQCT